MRGGRQDGAHGGALDARDVGAQLVACSSRRLEQPLRGQALHEGGERVGHCERGGGHGLVEDGTRGVVICLGEDALDRSRSALSVRSRPEGAEGAGQIVERHRCHHPRQTGLGDDPVLRTLPPRGGVVGWREGLDVA